MKRMPYAFFMSDENPPQFDDIGTIGPARGQLMSDPSMDISAEELLSTGSIDILRGFLKISPDPDALRRELFMAGQTSLVGGANGKLKRVGLYGWPIVIDSPTAMRARTTPTLIGKNDEALYKKLASIWGSALGSRNVAASPIRLATHLDLLLGMSPFTSRRCLNRGLDVLAGKTVPGWSFATEADPRFKLANLGQTTTFIACAWVTWDVDDPTPKFHSKSEAVARLVDLARAMLCTEQAASTTRVVVGSPCYLNEAVSDGLRISINEVCRYATSIGRDFELEFVGDPAGSCLTTRAVIRELGAGTLSPEDRAMQWCYDTTWLPMDHQEWLCHALQRANETLIAGRIGLMPPSAGAFRH